MPLYESVYIARPDISATQVEALTADMTKILEDNGGKVTKDEYWGLKSLAYRIKKNRKGHYSLLNIDSPPAALSEMERNMRLHEDVLRYMSIRVEEHEEELFFMLLDTDAHICLLYTSPSPRDLSTSRMPSSA